VAAGDAIIVAKADNGAGLYEWAICRNGSSLRFAIYNTATNAWKLATVSSASWPASPTTSPPATTTAPAPSSCGSTASRRRRAARAPAPARAAPLPPFMVAAFANMSSSRFAGQVARVAYFGSALADARITAHAAASSVRAHSFTLEALVSPDSVANASSQAIVAKYDSDSGGPRDFYLYLQNDDLFFGIPKTGATSADWRTITASNAMTTGWHHVVARFDADANELSVFVNGVEVATNTTSPSGDRTSPADARSASAPTSRPAGRSPTGGTERSPRGPLPPRPVRRPHRRPLRHYGTLTMAEPVTTASTSRTTSTGRHHLGTGAALPAHGP